MTVVLSQVQLSIILAVCVLTITTKNLALQFRLHSDDAIITIEASPMCFSAQASFSTAIAMSALGLFSLSQTKSKEIRLFAAIPLFFACQQALEGVIWLTFGQSGTNALFHQASIFGYLFFASMFWPIWVPASLYTLETNVERKKVILSILVIGFLFSIIYAINWTIMGMSAMMENRHVVYPFLFKPFSALNINHIRFLQVGLWVVYCLCTVVIFFCSSVPFMTIIGIYVALTYIIADLLYHTAIGSVWCFFAAFFSLISCFVVIRYNRSRL